jgi:general secretion pathway protein K
MLTNLKTALLRPHYVGKPPTKRQKRRRQRGVALMSVLFAIAITIVISNQFGTSTQVDIIAAANYRDQMRSHFLARSAQNLSVLVVQVQKRLDNTKQTQGVQITDFVDQVLLAFCGTPEQTKDILGFNGKGLGADIGTCGVVNNTIKTEDDKININCSNGNASVAAATKSFLDALFYFQAYDPIFEDADADGYRRDRPTQSAAIVDYIDNDTLHVRDRGTTEDYGYEALKDPYKAKNTYIDSVGEMKLIRGIDDRFWTLFGPAFTAYGACKVNLATLNNTQMIAAILYLTAKNPNDPVIMNPQKLFMLAALVAKAKQFGETFSKIDDFVAFVHDPTATLGTIAGQQGTIAGSAATAAVSSGAVGAATNGEKITLDIDSKKLGQIATIGPRRTYRVEAWGEIERKQVDGKGQPIFPSIRSVITGVWDQKVTPQNARKTPTPNGAWVFLKED